MRILCLTGSQNSGKTTLMNKIVEAMEQMNIHAYAGFDVPGRDDGSVSRRSADKGFRINENSNFETQYHIALSYSLFFLETLKLVQDHGFEWWVIDRSILDHVLYALRNPYISKPDKMELRNIGLSLASRYRVEYMMLCEPVPHFKDDSYRSTNKVFQDEMSELFSRVAVQGWDEYNIPPLKTFAESFMVLPYSDGFSKDESISIRMEMALQKIGILRKR